MATGWERVAGNTGGTVGGLASATVRGQTFVYAATSVGVYQSSDAGRTWTLTGIRNTIPFAEAVVPSARIEQDRTIFVCAGDGLYRSSDGGEGWQPVLVGGRMLSVTNARDGRDGIVLLAGTEVDGILRSEDGGRTWAGANAGLLDLTALAIVVSPQFASDRLGFAGTASGLYRTRNGARSWREVETGLTEPSVQCVAISPGFASDRLVLAGTEADGLLRSDDAGATWQRPPAVIDEGVAAVAFSSRYPTKPTIAVAIESGIAVSDDGARTWRRTAAAPPGLVLSLIFVPAGQGNGEILLAGLHRQGVARSVDDGASWDLVNDGLNARLLTSLALSPSFAQDQTVFAAGPQDGVSVSVDGGRTWAEHATGLEDAAVTGVALSPHYAYDRTLYAATAAGIHVSHDAATTWTPSAAAQLPARNVATGPGAQPPAPVAPAPASEQSPAVAPGPASGRSPAVAPHPSPAVAPGPGSGAAPAIGAGRAWGPSPAVAPAATGAPAASDRSASTPRTAPGSVAHGALGAPLTVVAGLEGGTLLASDDGGGTWRPLAVPAERAEILVVALSPDYARDRTIFVATTSQAAAGGAGEVIVWRSVDGGARWARWLVHPEAGSFVALALSPSYATDELVFVGLGARVVKPVRHAREVHAGQRRPVWRGANLSADAVTVTAVAPSPSYAQDQTVFAASNAGVFVSRDGGETYHPWSEHLVPPAVVALAISPTYPEDGLVYALGLGGTIWRRRDEEARTADSGQSRR